MTPRKKDSTISLSSNNSVVGQDHLVRSSKKVNEKKELIVMPPEE
jgi:hypothetical protein